ncbi:MAG TPA: hypothetical protein VN799_06975 [Acidimicrobiales bacterium]|nr:hypothetical protein [Acidimicrobiales bacterium]
MSRTAVMPTVQVSGDLVGLHDQVGVEDRLASDQRLPQGHRLLLVMRAWSYRP